MSGKESPDTVTNPGAKRMSSKRHQPPVAQPPRATIKPVGKDPEPASVSLQCNIFCEREGDLQRSARNGSGLRQGHVYGVRQSPPVRPNRMLASAANETKSRVMLKKTMSAG